MGKKKPSRVTRPKPPWLDLKRLGLVSKGERDVFSKLLELLRGHEGKLARCLLGTSEEAGDLKGEMPGFVDVLIAELPAETVDAALGILSRLVQLHNQSHDAAKVPLPEISVKIPPVTNPFTSNRWPRLSRVSGWRQLMCEEITSSRLDNEALAYGRVLASAVLWGGLVSRGSLESLYDLLPQLAAHSKMVHGWLAVTWVDKGANHRRWLPDAFTALLLLRLPKRPIAIVVRTVKDPKRTANSPMTRDLLGYFRSAEKGKKRLPRALRRSPATLHELLDGVLLDLETRLPRVLTQYAAARQVSHSLRPAAWSRLMKEPPGEDTSGRLAVSSPEPAVTEADEVESDGLPTDEASGVEDEEGQSATVSKIREPDSWLPDLRITLKGATTRSSKRAALGNVRAYMSRSDLPAAARIVGGFAQELLEEDLKSRKGNTLRTLRTRVIAVATRLPGIVEFENPASLNADTLQAAYQQILEDASSENQRQKLAGHLRAFHRYLVKVRSVETIEDETFSADSEDLTVDANIIVEDDYQKALSYLSEGQGARPVGRPADPRIREAARLMLILGFRCGLRRMEVLKLQCNDFNGQDPAELLVRPWEQRRLKTPNATRKMPLYALLSESELGDLRAWKLKREHESRGMRRRSPFLFSIPAMEYTYLPEGLVFPLIHEALRAVTLDATLRYHSLRHSCASWIVYALLRPPKAPTPPWLESCPKAKAWLWVENDDPATAERRAGGARDLHQALYGNAFMTRRHLFAVSRLLGHSSPRMSLEHYVHTVDQLLALWLEKEMPRLKPEVWLAASGIGKTTVYTRLRQDIEGETTSGSWALARRFYQSPHDEKAPGKRSTVNKQVSDLLPPDSDEKKEALDFIKLDAKKEALHDIDPLWRLLYLAATEKLKIVDLARRFGFPEGLVVELLAVAAEAEQRRAGNQFLHPFEKRDMIATSDRIPCPRKPNREEEWGVVQRFAPSLWELMRTRPGTCRVVLNYYLETPRDERNGLEFRTEHKDLARQYLALLRELPVHVDELLILRYSARNAFKPVWEQQLGLKAEKVLPAAPPAAEKADRNDIGIKVVFDTADSIRRASYGMRYLLILGGIWMEASSRFASKGEEPAVPGQDETQDAQAP